MSEPAKIVELVYRGEDLKTENFGKNLNDHRINNRFCDFALTTTDGGHFPVHRAVISANSVFFDMKFKNSNNFHDGSSQSMEIKFVTANVLEKIIDFMYTSETKITSEYAKEMLNIAQFLLMDRLIEGCVKVLMQTINKLNCLELLDLTEKYCHTDELQDKCFKFILRNMDEILDLYGLDGFVEISFETMLKLYSFERNGCSEEFMYSIIINWISHDIEKRKQYVGEFLDLINFELMDNTFLITNVFENNPLSDDLMFLKKMFELQKMQLKRIEEYSKIDTEDHQENADSDDEMHEHEDMTLDKFKDNENIFPITGKNLQVFAHDDGTYAFRKITNIDYVNFAYTKYNGNLLICGGSARNARLNNICKYFIMNKRKWQRLQPMLLSRIHHKVVTLNDKIYACGGIDEKSIEIYNPNNKTWLFGQPFPQIMSNFGLCTHENNALYALKNENLYRLDTREINWDLISTTNIVDQSISNNTDTIAAYYNYIYKFDQNGMHQFDLRCNKWIENIKYYQSQLLSSPEVCVYDNELCLLGFYCNQLSKYRYILQTFYLPNFKVLQNYQIRAQRNQNVSGLIVM